MVSALHPREQAGHFNFSLVLFQLGQYEEAIAPLDIIIK